MCKETSAANRQAFYTPMPAMPEQPVLGRDCVGVFSKSLETSCLLRSGDGPNTLHTHSFQTETKGT